MGRIRTCNRCKTDKDIEQFYRDARMPLGRRYVCKVCSGKAYAKWQKQNPEKIKALNKKAYGVFKGTMEYRYWRTKASAKQRVIGFELSIEQFKKVISSPCFYCGSNGTCGIDRVDSNLGYITSNITPACYRCNVAKNTMTQEEFITLCKLIVNKHEGRNTI